MRTDAEKLRTCPTCGTKVEDVKDLGLRNYQWINQHLPGKVGLMDIDGVLERRGKVLMLETKPFGATIPLGQRITLLAFVKMGVHVWVCWSDAKDVHVGRMDERGEVPFITETDVSGLIDHIVDWWDAADRGEL
jgi:hypothetical protein